MAEAIRRVDSLPSSDRSEEIDGLRQKLALRPVDAGGVSDAGRLRGLVAAQQSRSEAQPTAEAFRCPESGPEL
jgi:hypothetical protein